MPQFQIDVQWEVLPPPGAEDLVRFAVKATLIREHERGAASVTILLTDEKMIRSLNRQFMGADMPTDVLSFPAGDPTPGAIDYLGDIAISVPTANKQAASAGYPVTVELQLLAIHATLHLLGFDHLESEEKRIMWQAQYRVLMDLGIEYASPP